MDICTKVESYSQQWTKLAKIPLQSTVRGAFCDDKTYKDVVQNKSWVQQEYKLDWGNNNSEKLICRVMQSTELLNPSLH